MKRSFLPIALSTSLALVFVACTPQGEGTSSPPEASSSSADAGLDAARESGSTSDGASACPPETRGYEPLVDAPPRPAARACTDTEVSTLVRDCLESADRWFDPACTAHTDACAACMLSKGSDKAWGPSSSSKKAAAPGSSPINPGASISPPGCRAAAPRSPDSPIAPILRARPSGARRRRIAPSASSRLLGKVPAQPSLPTPPAAPRIRREAKPARAPERLDFWRQ